MLVAVTLAGEGYPEYRSWWSGHREGGDYQSEGQLLGVGQQRQGECSDRQLPSLG